MLKILVPVFATSDWPRNMRPYSVRFNNPLSVYRSVPRPSFAGSPNRASDHLLCISNMAAAALRMQPRPPSVDYTSRCLT